MGYLVTVADWNSLYALCLFIIALLGIGTIKLVAIPMAKKQYGMAATGVFMMMVLPILTLEFFVDSTLILIDEALMYMATFMVLGFVCALAFPLIWLWHIERSKPKFYIDENKKDKPKAFH